MDQNTKEKQYIRLLENIVSYLTCDTDIIFDAFNKKDFENAIIQAIGVQKHVLSINSQDSELECGLQFIDNICSIIRLYKTKRDHKFHELIDAHTVEV